MGKPSVSGYQHNTGRLELTIELSLLYMLSPSVYSSSSQTAGKLLSLFGQ
jgi:hypothetical protein